MQPWRRPETSVLLGEDPEEGAEEDEGVSAGCASSEGGWEEGWALIFVIGMEYIYKKIEKKTKPIVVVYQGITAKDEI